MEPMPPKTANYFILFAATMAFGQENGPAGLLKGDLLAWNGTTFAGQFTFHTADDHTYSCSYDGKTYFERENQRITMAGAAKGDRIEVVSDHRQAVNLCYALTVHVLDTPRAYVVPGLRPRPRPAAATRDLFPVRGDLTISGVVLRLTPDVLILRARSGEHKTIRLRPDTKFLTEGESTGSGTPRANTVVFVRARKNLDDEIEAYQVIWGEILQPVE
jgi:hypothetical protein